MRTGNPQKGNMEVEVQDLRHGDWYRWENVWRKATDTPEEQVCTAQNSEKVGDARVCVKRASGYADIILWGTRLQVYREKVK